MRRFFAIALLMLFGLPLMQPLLAMSADTQSNLPLCCRRNGAHRCMRSAAEMAALLNGTQFSIQHSQCPMFPRALGAVHHEPLALDRTAMLFTEAVSHPALYRQTEAWARVALEGARHKRGPPVELS